MQQVLAGRYRLERQLGKGGMGSVWLAEHLALRSWVAVKLMDPAIAATPEGAERFRREAQAAASLRSAHVVQVLDYGLHETTPFLVMELLQGESLAGCLEREKRLTPERTLAIVTQVARALGRAHQAGIVHRDLKPDNVFLVREDDQELVKILDFGIAKTPASKFGGVETRTGVTMGTPYYMSPEQVEGKKAVDHRTDLWAMAVITSECLTGVRPFDGSTYGELLLNICARPVPVPSSLGPVPPSFDAWFFRATNRDPEQRFQSAQELATALRDLVGGAGFASGVTAPAPGGFSTGTLPGQPPFAAAATGGPPQYAPAPGAAFGTAPSVQTSQPLEVARRSGGKSALPWVLLGGFAVLAAGVGAVLLVRPKADDGVAASASGEVVAATPSLNEPARAPAPAPAPSPPAAATATPQAPSLVAPVPRPAETPAARPAPASPLPILPTPAPAPLPTPANTTSLGPPKTLRCFSDPFSGQLRPAGSGRSPNAATFPCKQDPFTGKYKKL
jgi:eukaryotic-like serine/threonine-protein kinase